MSVELPNGKISLTLPEQVGQNAKDIDEIKKVIDGLESLDNVVVVSDISHVMTAAELKSVKQPVCFIVYNNHLYIKRNEQSGTAYFDVVFSIVATNVISFQSSQITVNLSNGALGIINSTVSTYSNSKVDELLALKASITYVDSNFATLAGANFTGAITAPSIIENMNGYDFDPGVISNCDYNVIYAGAVKNGNKLTLVVFGSLEWSTTASSTNSIGTFTIPQNVYDKLYPFTLGESTGILAFGDVQLTSGLTSAVTEKFYLFKGTTGKVGIGLIMPNGITPGTTYLARMEVTFLLSDNLAQ